MNTFFYYLLNIESGFIFHWNESKTKKNVYVLIKFGTKSKY